MEPLNPTQPVAEPPIDPMDKFSKEPENIESTQPITSAPLQSENTAVHQKSKKPLIALFSVLAVLIILIASGAFLALVAYGKVDINNRELERKISFAIQALPYTPKTAEYLFYQTFEAQKNMKSMYIDASVALSGTQATEITGLGSNFDFALKGSIDLHDKNNPMADVNLQMTPELDADLITLDDKLFFRINSIPAVIKGFATGAGFSLDPLLTKWISYDIKSLESEARDTLNEDKGERDSERIEKLRTAILNSDVMKKIVVKSTTLEAQPVYEMSLEMTSDEYLKFLNEIAKAVNPDAYGNQLATASNTSEKFENLKITTYVDKKTMYTVRSMISFRAYTSSLTVPSQVLGASTIQYFPNVYTAAVNPKDEYMDVAVVISGTRFNETFDIHAPVGATPLEEIIEQYTEQMMMKYQNDALLNTEGFDVPEDDTGITQF